MNNEETTHYKQMITTLEKYGKYFKGLPDGDINMGNGGYPCGSPCCVGGYIAFFNGEKIEDRGYSYYTIGAEIFTKEMGFKSVRHLQIFFAEHPDIWGNNDIWGLFLGSRAYNEGGKEYNYGTLTTTAIANKFSAVAERLKKILEDNK